mgnify:CR=1 FL=1
MTEFFNFPAKDFTGLGLRDIDAIGGAVGTAEKMLRYAEQWFAAKEPGVEFNDGGQLTLSEKFSLLMGGKKGVMIQKLYFASKMEFYLRNPDYITLLQISGREGLFGQEKAKALLADIREIADKLNKKTTYAPVDNYFKRAVEKVEAFAPGYIDSLSATMAKNENASPKL